MKPVLKEDMCLQNKLCFIYLMSVLYSICLLCSLYLLYVCHLVCLVYLLYNFRMYIVLMYEHVCMYVCNVCFTCCVCFSCFLLNCLHCALICCKCLCLLLLASLLFITDSIFVSTSTGIVLPRYRILI